LNINSKHERTLVERVDSILATRRGLLPAVQHMVDETARRKLDVKHILSLLAELKEVEKDESALRRIESAIHGLDRLLTQLAAREDTLDALRVRFGRETINIGVSGEARVGKSTTLQQFSGLTDTQIPTGKGLPVTAVRSEIYNSADERAEVTFRDEPTFLAEYVQPLLEIVNSHLESPLSVNTLSDLRTAKLPETLGANVDSVSTDSLSRLLDAQRSLNTYESLLTGSVEEVALGDLRSYVAYPTKDDLNAEKGTGTPPNRSHLAVKSVKILCPFPRLEGLKIGLVDLPGLGEIAESVADLHLRGLEDGVDHIFSIMRPTDAEGYAKQGIAKNIDHLRRIQPGIKRRSDLITAGINVSEGLSETVETLRDDFERRINGASHDRIELLEFTAVDDTSVADLFDTLLQRVSDSLPTMDQEVFAYALAKEAGEATVTKTLAELSRTLTDLLRLIPIPEALILKQIDRIASDLIHEYNVLQKKLEDAADEHSEWYVNFDTAVKQIHNDSDALIKDGFFLGHDAWESTARGQKDYYNWYRNEAQRLRREIIAQYSGLDVFYDDHVTQFKNDVIRIFFDNTGELDRKLQVSSDDDPEAVIDRMTIEFGGTIQDDDLESALELLKQVRFSFRNNVFLAISRHLEDLANPSEWFEPVSGTNVENIRDVLGVVGNYEHQLERLNEYLSQIATEANDAICESLLMHDDQFHEYLSVSIAFFNDFLYRKNEENFRHIVIRALIREYRDYVLGEHTDVFVDSKKKDLIDRIKAMIQDVAGEQNEQPTRAARSNQQTQVEPTEPQIQAASAPLVEAKSDPTLRDTASASFSDDPWVTPLPGSTN
jgi:hypothetical protein